MVGAYRETVTKILDELQREGVVELARQGIVVRRRDAPSALLERRSLARLVSCPGSIRVLDPGDADQRARGRHGGKRAGDGGVGDG